MSLNLPGSGAKHAEGSVASLLSLLPGQVRDFQSMWGYIRSFHSEAKWSCETYMMAGACGRLMMGWSQAPLHFCISASRYPVDLGRDCMFYPACFIMWGQWSEEVAMACEAILLQQSKPWWVHISRVRNARLVKASGFPPLHRLSAIQNCWVQPA